MPLSFYNSMTRRLEVFEPLVKSHVGIYICGPTVYGPPHLGHVKSYITFDVLVKHLRKSGMTVRYVQNITDVGHLTDDADSGEDKIQRQARLDKVHPWEIVDKYMFRYFRDMAALKITHPSFYVRASQHIGEQIEAIETLIRKGHAYEVDGNVYFDVSSYPEYGKLSGRVLEEQQEGVRVETRGDKRHPRDFALWKKAEPEHILKWNSPWGPGYPGWHIECSVMSTKYLGETFDIHGGGLENMFPHHECEIAQSCCCNEKPLARYWLHNNMVTVDGVKMGKSLGNFKTCEDLLSRHSPEALRYFILSTHYRSPTNYTEEAITAAATGLARLTRLVSSLRELATRKDEKPASEVVSRLCAETQKLVVDSLDDDLDTPGAFAEIFSFVSSLNKLLTENAVCAADAKTALSMLESQAGDILGVIPETEAPKGFSIDPIMDIIIDLRKEMKLSKRYDLSDLIRNRLQEAGIRLEDTKEGIRWHPEK